MKAQASVEYLVIIGLALAILVPLILYSNQNLLGYKEDVKISSAKAAASKIAESANWVYSQGPPARLTINVCIPEGVEEVLLDSMVLFKLKTSAGIVDIYSDTIPMLNGSVPTNNGCYFIALIADKYSVNITVVE